ncbi:MAG: 1-acyl-sn-glycerol-3-phosphate acyltransferase [Bacteroidetes bacterium]|nr:1-acyl-sn-glycerol-3-phosphate acyltransferase [Bacteroidota bacterium]
MKRIAEQIIWLPWTIWCGSTFSILLLLSFPILIAGVMSGNERWIRQLHFIPLWISRTLLVLWGIRIELHEEEPKETLRQAIFISNHTSYLDALVAGTLIRNYVKFLGKAELLYWPVLGYLIKHLYVPVRREDSENRAWSMEQMKEKVHAGASFFICPEGTCNTTPELLKHFHSGAFRLAVACQIPLVVFTIVNAGRLFPRKGLMIRPGRLVVYRHRPIETTGMVEADVERLKEQAIALITTDLEHESASKF